MNLYQNPIVAAGNAKRAHDANEFILVANWVAAAAKQGGLPLAKQYAINAKHSDRVQTIFNKAAVSAIGLNSGIAEYNSVVSAFLGSLKNSAFDTMLAAMQRVPLHSRVNIVVGGMTATTVGEAMVKPISNVTVSGKSLALYKVDGIVCSTDEFFKLADPEATALFGRELKNAIAIETDTKFLSLISTGVSPISSSGGAAANVLLDLDAAAAALDTDASSELFIITTSDVAKKWAFKTTADGTPAFPQSRRKAERLPASQF
jgi:hypothetical protein